MNWTPSKWKTLHCKTLLRKLKETPQTRRKLLLITQWTNDLHSKYIKKFYNSRLTMTNQFSKNEQKIWRDTLPKKILMANKPLIDTQHHLLLEKCKLNCCEIPLHTHHQLLMNGTLIQCLCECIIRQNNFGKTVW